MNDPSPLPYKGTRDYYPEEKQLQNYIFKVWRKVCESYGYEEYSTPILEPLDLYLAKSGQELASEQTYSFTDRGGRVVAIRPEMTPSVSRLVAGRRQEMAYPARLYSIANFMRYERPQKGREREFWQLNLDIFGVDSVLADAEIITISDKIMQEFGAKDSDYIIRINNRQLINFMMAQYLGLDSARAHSMIKLLDRKDKIGREEFRDQAREMFEENQSEGMSKLEKILDAKTMADLPEEIKNNNSVKEIQALFTLLERAGVKSAVFDSTLMRGLDYYTGTVFEVYDTNPDNSRALYGGGRYDGLVGLFGAEPLSAVGVAPGATVLENFLQTHNLIPKLSSKTDAYICVIGQAQKGANILAKDLREAGLNIEIDITDRKLDRQIKTADKKKIPNVIFVGEDEIAKSEYVLKNILTGEEFRGNKQEIFKKLS
jgi:histidyl-tRNA synthetase